MSLSDQLAEAVITDRIKNHPEVVAAREALRRARAELEAAEMADDSKRERAANKAVREADKAYVAAKKLAREEPRKAAQAQHAANLGICQICQKAFRLKGRVLVKHGWKEYGGGQGVRGFRAGVCPGAYRQPLQVTKEDLAEYVREREVAGVYNPHVEQCKVVLKSWKPDAAWMKAVGYR